ncbi:Citrate synthase [Candidatus Xenohaliotis californiensis]|uniref:Citrate synthase n=1 Tax=Candidatus Xenohaliotis californiensis TaxID=84677 RepID=A0ABP0ERM6_9RICK|nr:Citrate synthase [Candidatus Xenohaliotis californiensis]
MHKKMQVTLEGKTYEMPLYHGSCGPSVVDVEHLYEKLGVYTYDFGFVSTASCHSSLTYVDGEQGILRYRGYNVSDLAENNSFLDVCHLLLMGELPNNSEISLMESDIANVYSHYHNINSIVSNIDSNTHPMAMLGSAFFLSTIHYSNVNNNYHNDNNLYYDLAAFVLAHISMVVATIYRRSIGLEPVRPNFELGYLDNFIHMMFFGFENSLFFSPEVKKAIEVLMILHADHGQNASTSTVRIVASTYAHPIACFAAGIAALWGSAHGGANEHVIKMLQSIGSVDNVNNFIDKVENRKDGVRLMGFGHRVYKNFDPRAIIIKKECHKILELMHSESNSKLFKIAKALEKKALSSDYFASRHLYPNVDFYSGILLSALKIPSNMFTCIFVLSRMIGWVSQLKELMMDPEFKIHRPRQLYVGEVDRNNSLDKRKAG